LVTYPCFAAARRASNGSDWPRTLVSRALESRANVSGEASPESVPKVFLRQRF
jgi:hypothetical protein